MSGRQSLPLISFPPLFPVVVVVVVLLFVFQSEDGSGNKPLHLDLNIS